MARPKTNAVTPERASRVRQRQRLIDACISALHIHGPSRTTVEKVVALADLSPGIVRFYFDSKDAMLLASLAHLAAEFEQRVMLPVARLQDTPVAALEKLVELYFDSDIASPRKVSVWYSFWGEASSRQEYYDICGRKDEDFAALVRDLVARVVAMAGEAHLDADGIALGLMGALEVLWQGIAFQSEADIDREAARRQSLAFLRSVFPKQFVGTPAPPVAQVTAASDLPRHLPSWAYSDANLLTAERERFFRASWQAIGHAAELPEAGDYLSADLGGERVLVVRDENGTLRAFRNACRRRPHALVTTRTGHFSRVIECVPHGLTYSLEGKVAQNGVDGDLTTLEVKEKSGVILVRAVGAGRDGGPALTGWNTFADLVPVGVQEVEVAADWKLLVEQWLEGLQPRGRFLAPNQMVEAGRGGAVILRALPLGPGRSRLQRLDFGAADARKTPKGKSTALDSWFTQQVELAESTQAGLAAAGDSMAESGPVSAALAEFRGSIAVLLPHLGD